MITSASPGRIRVRTARLKAKRFVTETQSKVRELPGVISVRCNLKAGSLVVNYDQNTTNERVMEKRVEAICMRTHRKPGNKRLKAKINQVSKIGMVTTLVPSVIFGFAGKRRLHVYTGIAFLVFAGIHTLRYNKTLFR
ncbi:MAG: hypothetical protein CSA50_04960 [Gammaproteobacteria bacterium]|nr:MAG: hypothetical protein CSA50_04960 [Gammaproteobacteria bacterium]